MKCWPGPALSDETKINSLHSPLTKLRAVDCGRPMASATSMTQPARPLHSSWRYCNHSCFFFWSTAGATGATFTPADYFLPKLRKHRRRGAQLISGPLAAGGGNLSADPRRWLKKLSFIHFRCGENNWFYKKKNRHIAKTNATSARGPALWNFLEIQRNVRIWPNFLPRSSQGRRFR